MPTNEQLQLDAETFELARRMAEAEGTTPEDLVMAELEFFLTARGCPRVAEADGGGSAEPGAGRFF